MSSTDSAIVQDLSAALPVAETIVSVLFPGAGGAAVTAFKIAQGVLAGAPDAIALYEQFKSGQTPSQADIDAYAHAETGSYNKLMADIAAKRAGTA